MSESIRPGLKVTWHAPKGYTKRTAHIVKDFTQTSIPLISLAEPDAEINEIAAAHQSIKNLTLLLHQPPNRENIEKKNSLTEQLKELAQFAENHPFLTAGFLIAMLLVVLTAYLTVETLLGHTTISIFKLHPELSAGLTFMCLNQSVCLINMCRRVKIKDDLEARIHASEAFTREVMESQDVDFDNLTKVMNREIKQISIGYIDEKQKLREQHKRVREAYKKAKSTYEDIQQLQQKLLEVHRNHTTPKRLLPQIEEAMAANAVAINQGAQLLAPKTAQLVAAQSSPAIPLLEFTKDTANFEPISTELMREYRLKNRTFTEKFEETMKAIAPFLKKNPVSAGLFVIGFTTCVLSGLAMYYYFHGATTVYFFGALSLLTVIPMVCYGISLIYEGYNTAMISNLEEERENIEKIRDKRQKALEQRQNILGEFLSTAFTTLAKFTNSWNQFKSIENERLNDETDHLYKDLSAAKWDLVQNTSRTILRTIEALNPVETQRITESLVQGAITIRLPKAFEGAPVIVEYESP